MAVIPDIKDGGRVVLDFEGMYSELHLIPVSNTDAPTDDISGEGTLALVIVSKRVRGVHH